MELIEYKAMYDLEENHWWCKGLRNLVFSNVKRFYAVGCKPRILDAGCGAGITLKGLNKYGEALGIDIVDEALKYCGRRGLRKVLKASITQIPFRREVFDLVISNDVLCHKLVVNDEDAIEEINRILKSGGLFIVNLPAHNYLRRWHDMVVHTKHRYETSELCKKLERNNFKIIKVTYRNALLWPVVLALKFITKKDAGQRSDLTPLNNILNLILYYMLCAENLLLRIMDLPFGTSVFCVSQKR